MAPLRRVMTTPHTLPRIADVTRWRGPARREHRRWHVPAGRAHWPGCPRRRGARAGPAGRVGSVRWRYHGAARRAGAAASMTDATTHALSNHRRRRHGALGGMKPAPFEYVRVESVARAVEALERYDGNARCLA